MGGNSASTPQNVGSQLQQLFMQGMSGQTPGGYQQPNQVAPIAAPQYGGALEPSPDQAAAATRARIMSRTTPMAAPAAAPKRQSFVVERGGNGSAGGRAGN